jgi:K+-transporting ATPase ATPase A chain
MHINVMADVVQIVLFLVILTLLAGPLGRYMARVYQGERTFLMPVFGPLEKLFYRVCGIKRDAEMNWKQYATALLVFSFIGFVAIFLILMLQGYLPFNPEKFPGFSWNLALNTAVSFLTNTNWQAYSGESAASYFTQVIALQVHQFYSAAAGMVVAIALIRGIVRRKSDTIGNFWVDMTRSVLYILLPISFLFALVLVSQGVIQNFSSYKQVRLLQPYTYENPKLDANGNRIKGAQGKPVMETVTVTQQTLPMGPVASQEAIKELGTNGGGWFNANSAHPFENPTPLSNVLEILVLLIISAALPITFGRMAGKKKEGWAIYTAMMAIFVIALGVMYWAEYTGNPLVQRLGVQGTYMEGKEVRFGLGGSVLFSVSTTATACGAVNNMHDSLTPIGGMVPLTLILLSEEVFGGVGSGLYTMLAFVIISVFVSGLMIGRIPEYLGKKVEATEMWMSIIVVLASGVLVLIFTSIALITKAGVSAMANPGPHGLSEVLYAFASMSNNNGSAFAGINAGTLFYTLTGSIAMIGGRYAPAVAALAMAGSLAKKKYVPPSPGTLPTDQLTFIIWLVSVILIVGALTFFPALSLGPIVEHMMMIGGR